MTARPPVETLEASSEPSSGPSSEASSEASSDASNAASSAASSEPSSESTSESSVFSSGSATESETAHLVPHEDSSEPSMSKTIEEILARGDLDDAGPVSSSSGIGTKTLLGIGVSGLPLPSRAPKLAEPDPDGELISVEDMFAEGDEDDQEVEEKTTVTGEDQVGDLLGEVAEALNVQASESRERAIGQPPSRPSAGARLDRSVHESAAEQTGELEFEDPDDGPTTLNAGGESIRAGVDEDEEAVVLGPAKLPGYPATPSSTARFPGAAPPGAPGASARRATPFAGSPTATLQGFSVPTTGKGRLPTPAGGHALPIPAPSGGRGWAPSGTPVNGVPEAAAPEQSSRRSAAGRVAAELSERSSAASAVVRKTMTHAMESASVTLKRDLHFRVGSFGAALIVTFVGGLLLGRVFTGSGKATATVVSTAIATAPPAAQLVKVEPVGAPVPPASGTALAPPGGLASAPGTAPTTGAPSAGAAAAAVAPGVAVGPAGSGAPAIEGLPPPAGEAAGTVNPAMAFDPQPIHRRRARRPTPVVKDDLFPAPAAPGKPATPTRGAASGAPAVKATKAPAPAPAKSAGKATKSTWHDPFAD